MYHGKKTKSRKKRKYEVGREFMETKVGDKAVKKVRTKGKGEKIRLLTDKFANVVVDGKNIKCEITGVEKNPGNKDYTRRSIITKGSILNIKTPEGKSLTARVTSRPGQDGVLNAIPL